ncbi:hypothetical protein BDM02DRAFT_3183004 [Thelephora ganbajun]|uniref:Uncharacterized protein n=1 Tax=Thelephora ganbajun TaxID=370292 RepID=A0ACB6ZUD0_THEGA|nr:hypothetical protein BDM02DRAFT_3183004 [Thelephora ganbajun]
MTSFATSLASIARSKLQLSVSNTSLRDTASLHRWVLLKNSIVRSQPSSPASSTISEHSSILYPQEDPAPKLVGHDSEGNLCDQSEAFLFPDPDALNYDFTPSSSQQSPKSDASEAQWLDSLLESFSDDDDEEPISTRRSASDDDQEYLFTSPSMSPVASSEDLVHHSSYYESPPIPVSYPIPYPPLFHPPLIRLEDPLSRTIPLQEVRHPYSDFDELDDLSVPEAIEDTSDDDSDTLTTPCRSAMSFANPSVDVDSASISLPPEVRPRVYVNTDAAYLYRFELDPLPFADDGHEYTHTVYHQEC